jgi:small-conductance mechanosensitive channel
MHSMIRRVSGQADAIARRVPLRPGVEFRRAIVFAFLAAVAYAVSRGFGVHSTSRTNSIVAYCCGAAFVVLAVFATRSVANELARLMQGHGGTSPATSLRVLVLIVGYVAILLLSLDVFGIPVGNLLLGGAVTGIILGIAAQQALGNLFAGLVLMIARPYVPGQRVRVQGGPLGGPLVGIVSTVGLIYTTLVTGDGPLNVPNSALLSAAIGPAKEASTDLTKDAAPEPDREPAGRL